MDNELAKNLSTLLRTFNDKRVVSQEEIKAVLTAIVAILSQNKKELEVLTAENKSLGEELLAKAAVELDNLTQTKIREALKALGGDYDRYLASLRDNATLTRADIEKATKAQNDRAFLRLQKLIGEIRMPQDGQPGKDGLNGRDGKDGSPDSPEQVRDKLETLTGNDRLDASAIKGLPDYFKKAKKAGKEMLVGGIRFFENLVDVSIISTNKRQDMLAQYDTTNNRWQDGVALTVSTTAPSNPKQFDIWLDIN